MNYQASSSGSNHLPYIYPLDDLPITVVRNFRVGAKVMSMDFHPQQPTVLAVGTNNGDISLWNVGSAERMFTKTFKVTKILACSIRFQAIWGAIGNISVNRCVWSLDGTLLGVAFSKHIVHLYMYNLDGAEVLSQHLEIDAHIGGVNDIAFAHPDRELCMITCGDDNTIRVWDVVDGQRLFSFEGHKAPVYSLCPHDKYNLQFLFSTAMDGKMKRWVYDLFGSTVEYNAPLRWCTRMAYNDDATRLFCCGTGQEGEYHLVEWDEPERRIMRTYSGLGRRHWGGVQFDTTMNRFLAAGNAFRIKFWDMNYTDMLIETIADGGLPACPKLRFNKHGSLLAVSTIDNGFKILANANGLRMLASL